MTKVEGQSKLTWAKGQAKSIRVKVDSDQSSSQVNQGWRSSWDGLDRKSSQVDMTKRLSQARPS